MGMLDTELTKWSDHFQYGQVFTLEAVKVGPQIKTEMGTDSPAQLKIGGKWYSLFGQALVNQIGRMDDEDQAAMNAGKFRVKVVLVPRPGNKTMKQIVGADWDGEVVPNSENNPPADDDIPF